MRATWEFQAVRHGDERSRVKRLDRSYHLIGTSEEALEFSRRVADYLRSNGVIRVEAWSRDILEEYDPESSGLYLVFRIRADRDKRSWITERNSIMGCGRASFTPPSTTPFFAAARKFVPSTFSMPPALSSASSWPTKPITTPSRLSPLRCGRETRISSFYASGQCLRSSRL